MSLEADVVVIGAGAAGLAAARRLAGRSFRTVVLEARDRIGGRVWSHSSTRGNAELGAEFIHGDAVETRALLRAAGIEALPTGGESWTLSENGLLERDDSDDFLSAARIFESVETLAGDESVDRFLRRFENDPSMRAAALQARAFVEGFDAADPAIASARAIAAEWRSGVNWRSARPLGGYARMFEQLRDDCTSAGAQIRLSTTVNRISWRRGGVAVEARTPAQGVRTLRARAAIVTLPLGVLHDSAGRAGVAFEPQLPPAKRAALACIVMGDAVRVALWFRTPFWERIGDRRYRDAGFFRAADRAFMAYWTQFPVRSSLIVAWAGGPKALALSSLAPQELIDRAVDGFGELLGERDLAREQFDGGLMHDWRRDPFARGAYSYVAAGGDSARADLAAPLDGVLFFAGEATSNDGQGGTVNGALQTGERAADEAAAALAANA